eukprot:IDg20690t1
MTSMIAASVSICSRPQNLFSMSFPKALERLKCGLCLTLRLPVKFFSDK